MQQIYDTRVGVDPDFPEELLNDNELMEIGNIGKEIGVKTGRIRKVNWLNLNRLINAINLSGVTHIVISKVDILEQVKLFKYYFNNELVICNNICQLKIKIEEELIKNCKLLKHITFSDNPYEINAL